MAGEGEPPPGSGGRSAPVWTDRVKEVLLRAARQAGRRREPLVRPEHLLLELCRTPGAATAVLSALGVDLEAMAGGVEHSLPPVVAPDTLAGPYPQDPSFREVVAGAAAEAGRLGHEYLGTEHLLLGMLALPRTPAAVALARAGVTAGSARAEVERILGRRDRGGRGGRGDRTDLAGRTGTRREPAAGEEVLGARPFEITVDSASARAVYLQIADRVKEGVATLRLRPGDRLPTVRALAARLRIAPGTVARAYAALERERVLVTGRARGTRVARRAMIPRLMADPADLVALLRPSVIAAFHLGATAGQLESALREAMQGIFPAARS